MRAACSRCGCPAATLPLPLQLQLQPWWVGSAQLRVGVLLKQDSHQSLLEGWVGSSGCRMLGPNLVSKECQQQAS